MDAPSVKRALSLVANVHLTRRDPISLVHFVTNRCNARCSFCFIDFDAPGAFDGEMTLAEIEQVTRSVGPQLQNVNLTGGEPFLRKEMLDIARLWFRNTQIQSIFVTSNGYFTDRMVAFARTLTAEFPGRKVIFSLSVDHFAAEHDRIRKVPGLFERCLASYHALREIPGVQANLSITFSHENHAVVDALYDHLLGDHGVRALTANLARDEGVYRIPQGAKEAIRDAYVRITGRIVADLRAGRLDGYDTRTLQGRLHNRKNVLMYEVLAETYATPHFVSPCVAGALFGVIYADGTVHPCEVLGRPIGHLRDTGFDFGALWHGREAGLLRTWIRDSNCHCTYECAWSFNILAGPRFQPALVAAALGQDA